MTDFAQAFAGLGGEVQGQSTTPAAPTAGAAPAPTTGQPAAAAVPTAQPAPAPAGAPPKTFADAFKQMGADISQTEAPEKPGLISRAIEAGNEFANRTIGGKGTMFGPMVTPNMEWSDLLKDPIAYVKRIPHAFDEQAKLPLVKFEGAMTKDEQEKHPLITGALERVSGMTNLPGIGVMAATSGLGTLPGAAGKVVPRLVSAGFSAAQIESVFKEVPAFRAAIAEGNGDAAEKIMGHMIVDLAGALLGGQHAITGEAATPAYPGIDNAVKDFVAKGFEKLGVTADMAKDTLSEKAGKAKQSIKDKIANQQSKVEGLNAIQRAFPPSNTTPYDINDAQIAYNALAEHHETVEDLRTPEDVQHGLDAAIKDNEAKVKAAIAEVKDETIRTDVMDRVETALKDHPRADFLDKGLKELEQYDLSKPSVSEADRIRRIMNSENQAVLKKNNYAIDDARATDPGFVAREAAAAALRDGVYDTLEAYGKDEGVTARELRQDEGSLIKFRNAVMQKLYNGDQIVRGTGNPSLGRKLGRGAIQLGGASVGAGAGGAVAGPFGAGAGAMAGREIAAEAANKWLPTEDMSRNDLIESAFSKKARAADVTETPSERQIKGRIRQPEEPAPKGQQEVPFGPPDLFGMNQGERTPMELRDEELGQINKVVQDINAVVNDPNATVLEKAEAKRRLQMIFGTTRGTLGETPADMIAAPTLSTPNEPHSLGAGAAAEVPVSEPEIEILSHEPVTETNASGESAASKEAMNRVATEIRNGLYRFRVDTRSGKMVPLIGPDAVDAKAGPYDRIVMRDPEGREITLDEGAKARPMPVPAARGRLPKL